MYDQLVELLNQFSKIDVTGTTNFRGIVMLRDELVNLGFKKDQANKIAMGATIQISEDLTDDELHNLIDPLAVVADKLATAFYGAGFGEDDVTSISENLSIELG